MAYQLESFHLDDRTRLESYVEFPYHLYHQDPFWIPKFRMEFLGHKILGTKGLFQKDFPFHDRATSIFFMVKQNSKVVGTLCAFINHAFNDYQKCQKGFFGFFESINDSEVANILFQAAEIWCKKQGAQEILGPFNFSYNHTCGLLIAGFNSPPVVDMPYNPSYYQELIENAGYTKAKDFLSTILSIDDQDRLERLTKMGQRALSKHGMQIRKINFRNFAKDIQDFVEIYNDAWKDKWAFVPISLAEAEYLSDSFKMILDPNIFLFAEFEGKPVAIAGAVPDINQAMRFAPNQKLRPDWLRFVKFLINKRKVRSARMMLFGIRENFRRKGIEGLLFSQGLMTASTSGYTHIDIGWIHEDNHLMLSTIKSVRGELYKRYRVFSKSLAMP